MEFVFVTHILGNGGAERVISILANNIVKNGDRCTIFICHKTKNEYFLDERVKKIYIDENLITKTDGITLKINFLKTLRKYIKHNKPEYIIPFSFGSTLVSYIANIFTKTKLVTTIRISPYLASGFKKNIRDYIVKKSHFLIVQNKEQLEYFSKKVQQNAKILFNPVNDNFLKVEHKYNERMRKIVSCGRLTEQKNFKLLIDVIIKLHEKYNDVSLSIYGQGEDYEKLSQYIKDKNCETYVFLKGRKNDIHNEITKFDIFVLSSNYEGMPNALLEAMAVGLPCVSTKCPTGPQTLINHGNDGLLCEVNDSDDMYNQIVKYLNNSSYGEAVGMTSRKKIKELYNEEKITEDFYKFFE